MHMSKGVYNVHLLSLSQGEVMEFLDELLDSEDK